MYIDTVDIDVSKNKSMVTILHPGREIVPKPFVIRHLSTEMLPLVEQIQSLDKNSRILLEHTGQYYEPIAHAFSEAVLFVNAINPKLISDFQDEDNSLRKVKSDKSDKADSIKIACYALDRWQKLEQYTLTGETRNQLKNHEPSVFFLHEA